MKALSILALSFALSSGCAARSQSPGRVNAEGGGVPRPSVEGGDSVPPEWQGVDFKNFSYPLSWGRRVVRLDGGEFEFERDKGFEGGSGWFNLMAVHYADVTGDLRKEAIVRVGQVTCGGSCDGGAALVYFYTAGDRQPRLLWRFETGSLAYSCGLKSLAVKGGEVAVEVFRKCSLDGANFVGGDDLAPGEYHSKFSAKSFTRFLFEFDGRRFALKEREEVSPSPHQNVMNYSAPVSISDE